MPASELFCPSALKVEGLWFSDVGRVGGYIILEGTRGSGKTTVLKYFSFAVQSERAKSNNLSLINQIKLEKSIGFYFRCDDAFINTAYSLFQNKPKEHWLSFFEHYFELMISRFIVSLLKELIKEKYPPSLPAS